MRVREILDQLEAIAPTRFAFSFDKVGLQVGDPDALVERAVVSLDRSRGAVNYAKSVGAQLLLAHHPLIFSPLESIVATDHTGRTVLDLAASHLAFMAAHTNWDSAKGGVNDALAEALGLHETGDFGSGAKVDQLKVVTFVPEAQVDRVIDAMSEAGAGQIGNYERCAFRHEGTGTFLGNAQSSPTIGQKGQIEETPEVRIEMLLPAFRKRAVERALTLAHPYDEPAYDFLVTTPKVEQPAGRIGTLNQPQTLAQFVDHVDAALETRSLAWGDHDHSVQTVAVVGGSADGEWRAAQQAGADVLVTGEVKQHIALEAAESGFAIIAAGHYATEQPGVVALANRLRESCASVDWEVFVPAPGRSGRPL